MPRLSKYILLYKTNKLCLKGIKENIEKGE